MIYMLSGVIASTGLSMRANHSPLICRAVHVCMYYVCVCACVRMRVCVCVLLAVIGVHRPAY
jgi:hypothetical protein